jgi:hypothetical protein
MSDIQGFPQAAENPVSIIPSIRENTDEVRIGRDSEGKWLPGYAPNPGGRPKTAHIREAMQQRLAADGAAIVADVPFDIANDPKAKDSDRLNAVEIIRDTVDGKPVQAHMVAIAADPNVIAAIAGLAGRLLSADDDTE